MNASLIILDNLPDRLWFEHVRRTAAACSGEVYVLESHAGRLGDYPHWSDVWGWRRWLKRRGVGRVEIYKPSTTVLPVAMAAASLQIDLDIHLTGYPDDTTVRDLKGIAAQVSRFWCPGEFVVRRLEKAGFARRQIRMELPKINVASVSEVERDHGRRLLLEEIETHCRAEGASQTNCSGSRNRETLVLALPMLGNYRSLRLVAWAAAMLRHAEPDVRLIVGGTCKAEDRRRVSQWQSMWNAPGMVYLDNGARQWRDLTAACDLVLTGGCPLEEVMRLQYAREGGARIVGAGEAAEFLDGYDRACLVDKAEPRQLAGAVLGMIQQGAFV